MSEPDNMVLALLREMRGDIADVRSEMKSLRADVASDLLSFQAKNEAENVRTRKELNEQINGLRRAVMEYHSSNIGHGALISELEERMLRVEKHLDLPPFHEH